jgi:carboxyl-terminal processing protease
MFQNPKYNALLPLIFALLLILGIFIGFRLNQANTMNNLFSIQKGGNGGNKLNEVLNYIEHEYVDTIDRKQLTDNAIGSLLENLDPHSAYIPASELESTNESLQGNFEGIGIEFNILKDTIIVVSALSGGPSENIGVRAGDRIVKVDGVNVAGVKITNEGVLKKLKGKGGTKVKVTVLRRGSGKLIDFMITRDKIPLYSVDVAYMLSKNTGYIKINRFAATTYQEYMEAFNKLKAEGMQNLVVDLRNNGGGYLSAATAIADEFLENNKMIVYTKGKARPKEEYKATSKGSFENGKLCILIDEGSASASEILSGSIQDNDRGLIVGRRSFGKGLVQEQSEFTDGSAIRLTIARYYTATGRCIQKSYTKGSLADYYSEEVQRYAKGELQNADSIHFADTLKYRTPKGKIVYAGGGIMPDVFVPLDTTGRSQYLSNLVYNGVLNEFALVYADKNRSRLNNYKSVSAYEKDFRVDDALVNSLVDFAEKQKIKRDEKGLNTSRELIENELKALIARNIWRNDGFYPIYNKKDQTLNKALEVLEKQ